MEFLVLFPDGRSFGPANVETLAAWAREGRLLPNTLLENLATRERVPATAVAGIFPGGPSGEYGGPAVANYPRYNWQPAGYTQQPTDGFAVASLVLGVLSIVPFCIWFAAVPLGLLAVILGFIGKKGSSTGIAIGGIVCGFIGIVISLGFLGLVVYAGSGSWYR